MKRLKELINRLVRVIQRILIFTALSILYIFGFGITFIFAVIFNRRLLRIHDKSGNGYWVEAKGYEADLNECTRES